MVSTAQILSKRKRVSKKNKKAWRKHTDIKDVEKFLEEKVKEERTGGNPSEKKSSELFYIDKSDIFQTQKSKLESMKCHSDLQIDTRVAPVSGYSGPRKKKQKKHHVTSSESTAMPEVGLAASPATRSGSVSYDIWGGQPKKSKMLDPCLQPPVLPPQKYKTSDTSLPGVEVPHPGASYNPSATHHQELLQSALNVEVKREKAKAKATRDAAPPVQISEEEYLKEMSAGLNDDPADDDPTEDVNTGNENMADAADDIVLSVAPERKTKSQRNKEKAERLKAEDITAAKEAKRLAHQLNRVKAIKKEIRAEEAQSGAKEADRINKRNEKQLRPGKYGPGKMMEEQPDFLLPEEVSSSLRKLVTSSNAVKDRFTSLQKRNLIEVRKKVAPHRKYKLKKVEKWRKKLPEELDELVKLKRKKSIKMSE